MNATSTSTRRLTKPAAPDWQAALCAQTDPDLFFPDGRGVQVQHALEQAKRVCRRCPIRTACLEWALDSGQTAGVWGGLDADERRALLRKRAADRAGSYERCIDEQEYIERRVAEGATHRMIGDELGVGHSAVGRAWRFFQAERAAAGTEVVKAA